MDLSEGVARDEEEGICQKRRNFRQNLVLERLVQDYSELLRRAERRRPNIAVD